MLFDGGVDLSLLDKAFCCFDLVVDDAHSLIISKCFVYMVKCQRKYRVEGFDPAVF